MSRSSTDEEFMQKKQLLQELVDLEIEGALIVEQKKSKAKENKPAIRKKKSVDLRDLYLKPSTSGLFHYYFF